MIQVFIQSSVCSPEVQYFLSFSRLSAVEQIVQKELIHWELSALQLKNMQKKQTSLPMQPHTHSIQRETHHYLKTNIQPETHCKHRRHNKYRNTLLLPVLCVFVSFIIVFIYSCCTCCLINKNVFLIYLCFTCLRVSSVAAGSPHLWGKKKQN